MIDLSYAAAQQISLIESGSGEVEVTVVKIGKGDCELPAPFVVSVPDVKPVPAASSSEPPPVAFPLPTGAPAIVENVQVVEEHHGVETRRRVSADGRTIENVPVTPGAKPVEMPRTITIIGDKFLVQDGAFTQQSNANVLLGLLPLFGAQAHIDAASMILVRMGPLSAHD